MATYFREKTGAECVLDVTKTAGRAGFGIVLFFLMLAAASCVLVLIIYSVIYVGEAGQLANIQPSSWGLYETFVASLGYEYIPTLVNAVLGSDHLWMVDWVACTEVDKIMTCQDTVQQYNALGDGLAKSWVILVYGTILFALLKRKLTLQNFDWVILTAAAPLAWGAFYGAVAYGFALNFAEPVPFTKDTDWVEFWAVALTACVYMAVFTASTSSMNELRAQLIQPLQDIRFKGASPQWRAVEKMSFDKPEHKEQVLILLESLGYHGPEDNKLKAVVKNLRKKVYGLEEVWWVGPKRFALTLLFMFVGVLAFSWLLFIGLALWATIAAAVAGFIAWSMSYVYVVKCNPKAEGVEQLDREIAEVAAQAGLNKEGMGEATA